MIDRRTFFSLTAAAPFARKLDLPDIRVDNLELDSGVRLYSISPDGKTLVGTRDEEQLCFLDADSLEEIAVSDASSAVKSMFPYSLRWSPNGSKIAFNTNSMGLDDNPEIFVVDAKTGDISGLSAQSATPVATPTSDEDLIIQDLFPNWLDDETMIFVRLEWGRLEEGAMLMSSVAGTGEPTVWNELKDLDINLIYSLTHMRDDGRLTFLANPSNSSYLASPDEQSVRLFIAGAGEEIEQILIEDTAFADLMDADDTHAVIFNVAEYQVFRIALDDPSVREHADDIFSLEEGEHTTSIPAIGPVPGSMVTTISNTNRSVLVHLDGQVRELAYLRGPESPSYDCIWVEGKILVTSEDATWLIPTDDL